MTHLHVVREGDVPPDPMYVSTVVWCPECAGPVTLVHLNTDPIEVRPARPRRKKAIRRRSTVGKPRGDAKCPICGKGGFAGVRGVEVHAGRAHKGQITTRADLLKPRGERAQ